MQPAGHPTKPESSGHNLSRFAHESSPLESSNESRAGVSYLFFTGAVSFQAPPFDTRASVL